MQEDQKPGLYEAIDRHAQTRHLVWDIIVCFVLGGAFAFAILLVLTGDVQAQNVPAWEKLNEACQGAPLLKDGKANPACKVRNKVGTQLTLAGWLHGRHDVWVSPDQQNFAGRVIAEYDGQLGANLGEFNSLMPALLTELRTGLTDAQIFAIWNERQGDIRANAPYGAELMEEVMSKLAMHYARSGDPRLALGW